MYNILSLAVSACMEHIYINQYGQYRVKGRLLRFSVILSSRHIIHVKKKGKN